MSSASSTLPIGTDQHFRWLRGLVAVTLVLNLADAILTIVWIGTGLAREANPLMETLIVQHPVVFAGAKLGLVGLGSLLLWRHRTRPLAVVAMFVAFLVYYFVLLWHVRFAGLLVGSWIVP
jgi:hypothetical protein